jgi:broad specificity phosphatase PhoE
MERILNSQLQGISGRPTFTLLPRPARIPTLQNAIPNRRSITRRPALDTRQDGNGSLEDITTAADTVASSPPSTSGDLTGEVSKLRDIIDAQSRVLSEQQKTITKLEEYMTAVASTPRPASSFYGSPLLNQLGVEDDDARRQLRDVSINDRRLVGLFDARYHSTSSGATPSDFRILPRRIILVRHAESEGNVDNRAYTYLPDPQVPLTPKGWRQALQAGENIRQVCELGGPSKDVGRLFFYTSPYLRSKQTYEGVAQAFQPHEIAGVQEEVQLREQDFGNFQDAEGKQREKAERLRFGRFFYRFPNGESGADVYDRMTLFEDHLVRDINAGRFAGDSSLVLLTHGLAARVFLMRWFHWTVDQFMRVYNPPNAAPIVLERVSDETSSRANGPATWIHTKALYRLNEDSMALLEGCTPDMCETSWMPRGIPPVETDRPPEVHPLMEVFEGEQVVGREGSKLTPKTPMIPPSPKSS